VARTIDRLSPLQLRRLPKGMHPDGGGWYLRVSKDGARSWIFRYMRRSRAGAYFSRRFRQKDLLVSIRAVVLVGATDGTSGSAFKLPASEQEPVVRFRERFAYPYKRVRIKSGDFPRDIAGGSHQARRAIA
jgi:hypothetical protein